MTRSRAAWHSYATMRRRFVELNVVALAAAVVVRSFDAAYHWLRGGLSVLPDSLLHYNWLLTWWRHGDSPRGYTLTPAPYFIDMALQLPIMLLAPDFERFSYVLAVVYALLLLASLAAALRSVLAIDGVAAVGVAAVAVVAFYHFASVWLVMHAFSDNHTSEVFTTLGLCALVHAWFSPSAPARRAAAGGYVILVAACTASSPFFIATYCMPFALAAASLVGGAGVQLRRWAWLVALTAIGALAGLLALAVVARYAWPVRSDHWAQGPWKTYRALRHALYSDPMAWRLTIAAIIGVFASSALAVIARHRAWPVPARFALVFYPATVVAIVAVVVKRGAFTGGYELRYFLAPWLLTTGFYAALAFLAARALVRWVGRRGLPAPPRGVAWATGVLGAAAAALIATARGPLTMSDPASYTSRTIGCFADADRAGLLQDGLATVWLARYLNAARLAPGWASPHVLVEISTAAGPVLHPHENNAVWFSSGYRAGRAKLNFLITHGLSAEALRDWRERMGPPDRTITCPEDHDLAIDGKAAFEVWIWDRDDAQARLAEIVTHDNLRGAFAPVVGATALPIDVVWGMTTAPGDGALVGRRRVWRRGDHRDQATLATGYYVYVPGGRYRVDVELDAVPRAAASGPVAELVVEVDRAPDQRFAIAAGTHRATFEVVIRNPGAATSGNATRLAVAARDADALDLIGLTLTPLALDSIAPFEIFR